MPIIRRSASPETDPQTKQTKEFEYWRTAAELVERMREAGIAAFIVGGRAVITMAGAITMPRSWSLRRNIITTIDVFWLPDESIRLGGRILCFWLVEQTPAVRTITDQVNPLA